MAENKDINLIAIKSLIECIDDRDIADGGIFLDDDNAEFVADILRYHYKSLTSKNKMADVAKLFGKELGEEFDVRFNGKLKCLMFDKQRGLLYFDGDEWRKNYAYLDWLVRGKAVIVDD